MDISTVMQSLPDFYPSKGADESSINNAEAQLGLTFSEDYREYVRLCGDASVNGHELTGITSNERTDVVSVTKAERMRNPSIPADFYVVEQIHVDRIVAWQDSSGFIYQTIPGSEPLLICKSLSEYVS